MPTFEVLREYVIRKAGVKNHFEFIRLSNSHRDFWERINEIEFQRGYKREEYEKPGAPALCEMNLLTQDELESWKQDFKSFHRKRK